MVLSETAIRELIAPMPCLRKLVVVAALVAFSGLSASASQAEGLPPLKRVETARTLYDIGLASAEPLYLLAAARLRKSVEAAPVDRAPQGGSVTDGAPFGWQEMLVAAGPLIAGNQTLEGLAQDIRAERSKGVTDGPVYSIVDIAAGGRDVYDPLPFTGGAYAEVYVEGAPGTSLDVLVYDDQGRLVCADTDPNAIAYCGWRPATDGRFGVTVENTGGRGGRYSMMTN